MSLVPLGDAAGRDRWTVTHDGASYLVLRRDDHVVVTDLLCPHRQTDLSEALVRDGALVCPGHWYTFDLGTGTCRNATEEPLPVHPVVERDGELFAEVTVVEAPLSWSERLRAHARDGAG